MKRGPFTAHFAYLSNTTYFGFPSKRARPQGSLHGLPRRDAPSLEPSFIHLSKSPVYEPLPHTRFPSDGKGPPWREMPVSGDFLNISSRVNSEEAPPPPRGPPPRSLFRQRRLIHKVPFIHLSKSPADEPSSRFPKRGPYGKRCPSPEPFLHILQGPQQGSPPSRFPSQSSHRESHSTPTAPFNHTSKSPVDEPTPGCPTEPPRGEMPIPRAILS